MTTIGRLGFRTGVTAAVFAAGFLCGSVAQQPAVAGVGDAMKGAMEGAAGSANPAAKLGTSITDMQEHIDGLNKNMATLKEIQGMLGG